MLKISAISDSLALIWKYRLLCPRWTSSRSPYTS